MSTQTATPAEFALCVENADYPASLELQEIYRGPPEYAVQFGSWIRW